VVRAINFSSKNAIENFKLTQKAYLMGNLIEEFSFKFGFVMPNSTNNWDQLIEAADEADMIPFEVLSGNLVMETVFTSGEEVLYRSKITVLYK
jgi:retinal rod rhodopsin-sensitive cGMP 3',5'-cyclic phosphodiesterase subunit delta